MIYTKSDMDAERPVVWLHGEIKTPPFSIEARREAGKLLRDIQDEAKLSLPISRPMPSVGARCHELRIADPEKQVTWRIIYRIDSDAIVIGEVFAKKTQTTPKEVITTCKRRFRLYDQAVSDD